MDITPDPRMLKMLGEIEFEEWQCLAELIDNSFDSFLKLERKGESPGPGGWQVDVELPKIGELDGCVRISDNGPGMSREQLNNSVRAGFSSNDKYSNLGLFGMGFNVSTARLGDVTTISTQRSNESQVSRVTIDFNQLMQTKNFEAMEEVVDKEFPSDHGTTIEITKLKPARAEYLSRNAESISQKLGMTYSHLILTKGFKLLIQGAEVQPHRHCVWSSSRSVTGSFTSEAEEVPAVIEIDKVLTPIVSCDNCGDEWLAEGPASLCSKCGSKEHRVLERRIHGWVGVQRYLHPSEYGLDFLRNGRKILTWEKRLFSWRNPNDPSSTDETEYPSELAHQGGRIVGEIHLDHVPVSYTKDDFEYSDKGWKFMVEYLRGTGPIRPNKAKQAGFPENLSPLAKLIRAYKRSDPGTANLMPGDGSSAIHVTSREWGTKFRQGDADYQSDAKWWEAAQKHDSIKNGPGEVNPEAEDTEEEDIFGTLPIPENENHNDGNVKDEPKTLEQEIELLTNASVKSDEMSGKYDLGDDRKVSLDVFSTKVSKKLAHTFQESPIQIKVRSGNSFVCFFDRDAAAFKTLGFEPAQMILSKLSDLLSKRFGNINAEALELIIAKQGFGNLGFSPGEIKEQVDELLKKIIADYANSNSGQAVRVLSRLAKSDEQILIDSYSHRNGGKIPDLGKEEAVLEYLTPALIAHLFEVFPESFLNGDVFTFNLEPAISETSKRKIKWGILQHLLPLVSLMETPEPLPASELRDLRKNLDFIRSKVV